MIKNLEKSTVIKLKDQVPYLAGQVVSKTLAQNDSLSLTVLSFDKGEEISTHQSGGDAMVTVLEGTGRFTIDGEPHLVKEGETIVMPAKHPHAVYGEESCLSFKKETRLLTLPYPSDVCRHGAPLSPRAHRPDVQHGDGAPL